MTLKKMFDRVYNQVDIETKLEVIMKAITGQKWFATVTTYALGANCNYTIDVETSAAGKGLTLQQLETIQAVSDAFEVLGPKKISFMITETAEKNIDREYWSVI